MKRIGNLYSCLIIFALLIIMVGMRPILTPAATARINASVVNVRTGPGTTYDICGNIIEDSEVEVISKSGEWTQIKFASVQGWVHNPLLESPQDLYVKVKGELVNLRSGAGTDFASVGQAKKGEVLTLLDVVGDWYQVKTLSGQTAFIRKDLLISIDNNIVDTTPPATEVTVPVFNNITAAAPQVFLDGKQLQFSDAAPVIKNDRTLVPLRKIFEELGATVDWNDATRTVTARKGSDVVILPIGSTNPTVNGKTWSLDVPAQIMNNRTMAPLRFVGEAFGGQVAWDGTTRRIDITAPVVVIPPSSGNQKVAAVTVKETAVNLRSAPSTSADVLDLAPWGERLTVLAEKDGWYQVSRGGINRTAWVAGWTVDVAWEPNEPIPDVKPVEPEKPVEKPAEKPVVTPYDPDSLQGEVMHLGIRKDADGMGIVMSAVQRLTPEVEENSTGLKLTFKEHHLLYPLKLTEKIGEEQISITGANVGSSVEVDIKIPAKVKHKLIENNNGKEQIVFIQNMIMEVGRELYGDTGEKIMIKTLVPVEFEYDNDDDTLEITLQNINKGLAREQYDYVGKVLKYMKVKEIKATETNVILQITTRQDCKFNMVQAEGVLNIVATVKSKAAEQRENVVIIDPGHGGSESGAQREGIMEKDINLAVSLKVGKILADKGIAVAYTRDDDSTVGLEERARIANRLNGKIFVSIHANAFDLTDKCGTETYFYAPLDKPALFEQRMERARLAELIQKEMINRTQRLNRGVKEANYSVLRNTQMPSALVEMAFLSNPEERVLLCQPSFQQRAAEAIASAIEQYIRTGK